MAATSPVAKLLQRKLYTFVSSKWGLPVCVLGVLLLLISIFQFGEVFLEWSKERYAAQFSVYHDNIAGKSFERYITPELPIDIVYTWVNGSDPELLRGLAQLKNRLFEQEQREKEAAAKEAHYKNSSNAENSTSHTQPHPSPATTKCPFKHCVQWRVLLLDGRNLSSSLSSPNLRRMFPSDLNPFLSFELFHFNTSGKFATPTYGLRFETEERVTRLLTKQVLTTSGEGGMAKRNISITRGYLTSDGSLLSSLPLPSYYLLLCSKLYSNDTSTILSLRRKLEDMSNNNIQEFDVPSDGVGVVRLKTGNWTANTTIRHHDNTLTVQSAHVIWLPFELPTTDNEHDNHDDTVGANRFQDNEELRYSLRSVERYAPWIRHIFIVTNGQIPHWLDLENPRITIVTHEEIFVNQSHLPSYSSPAIESHLHRIPGLSKWFLYLNDDVMFGQEVWPHDFFTPDGGQKVYLSWSVPNCAEGCPPNWIKDNYCDTACNTSLCDWDGGDCANASRPGPIGGGGYSWNSLNSGNTDYCHSGCMPTWLGDRYCDSSCNNFICGYDAGDCGLENFHDLYSVVVTSGTPTNVTFNIPLETKAMYFNLTGAFPNGSSFTSADHTPCPVIRSAAISKHHKTLSLTFHDNKNASSAHFTIRGKYNNQTILVQFWVIADTVTKNSTHRLGKGSDSGWSFARYNDTTSQEFLQAVSMKLQNSNGTINYWLNERALPPVATPTLSSSSINYTVTNTSLLPPPVAMGYAQLRRELEEGVVTVKGYLKQLDNLLRDYRTLPGVHMVPVNDSVIKPTDINKRGVVLGGGANESVTKETENKPEVGVVKEDVALVGTNNELRDRQSMDGAVGVVNNHIELLREGGADHVPPPGGHTVRKLLEQSLKSHHWLPWERLDLFPDLPGRSSRHNKEAELLYATPSRRGRHLLDTFGDSLKHVNRLFNKKYGHKARKVPAHMPHMVNREIMQELQDKYPYEYDQTSSHQLRSSDDMQYSFSYFYYIIGETHVMSIEEVFGRLDTDLSGILSVRELRTLLVKLSSLPLGMEDVTNFETMLKKCGRSYEGTPPTVDPIEYETHYDPDLPLVTIDFMKKCSELLKKIKSVYGNIPKYSHEEMGEEHVAFKMLQENGSRILSKLDEVRKDQRKFICLNDNMDHSTDESRTAQMLLRDFYESLFPIPSQFELAPNYRNRFLYTSELKEWLATRWRLQLLLYVLLAVLFFLCFGSLFYGKVVQLKRRLLRFVSSFYQRTKSQRIFTV